MSRARGAVRLLAALSLLALTGGCAASPDESASARADEPAAGRFLVAARQVTGPVFGESVVLLVERSEGGALGLIVNRPTGFPLAEIFPELGAQGGPGGNAYLGGPVGIETIRALIRAEDEPEASLRVLDGVFVTSSARTLLRALAAPGAARRARAYLGYAGWAPGQLEGEIARGDWYVGAGDADAVFSEHPEALWDELIRAHERIRTERQGEGPPLASSSQGTSR